MKEQLKNFYDWMLRQQSYLYERPQELNTLS